jgi:N-acyl-D-aspartate/D-glutamate deacylase
MYTTLIKNALVIDGTSSPSQKMDVAILDEKIVAVQQQINATAVTVIDATGLILAPGFIDVQNHADAYGHLFDNPKLHGLISQGFTSAIVGASGASLAPIVSEQSLLAIQKWRSINGLNINWTTFAEYIAVLKNMSWSSNITSLVGYSTIRRGVLGDAKALLDSLGTQTALKIVNDSLQQGAVGVSLGLQYSHEINVPLAEVKAIAQVCKDHNKVLSVSLRNETGKLIEHLSEIIDIAITTGVKLKISHLKIRYPKNWHLITDLLSLIDNAWHRGAKIHFDSYPYTYTWQPLYTYFPHWSLEGGRKALLQRLSNAPERNKILSSLVNHEATFSEFIIASTNSGLKMNGKVLSSIATSMGGSSEEAMINLVENGGVSTLVFDNCLDPNIVNQLNNHPLNFIATNGGGFPFTHDDKLIHPRCFGTSTKFLQNILQSKSITLEEAIAKLTSRPAQKFNLRGRGLIKTGNFADLVLFDSKQIGSEADFQNPYQPSFGVKAVWVNGNLAVLDGNVTDQLSGYYLT